MAFIPEQYYYYSCASDYIFSNSDHCLPTPITSPTNNIAAAVHGAKLSIIDNLAAGSSSSTLMVLPPSQYSWAAADISSSMATPALGADNNYYEAAACSRERDLTAVGVYEVGEECSSSHQLDSSNFWPSPPLYPIMTADSWESEQEEINESGTSNIINGSMTQQKMEDSSTPKIARYSAEERKDRIMRYLKKRSRRNFNKTIKYACRKTLADKRVRIRGRFAKNELSDDDNQTLLAINNTSTIADHHHQIPITNHLRHLDDLSCYTNYHHDLSSLQLQMKATSCEEEYWLQEAIANFVYNSQSNVIKF